MWTGLELYSKGRYNVPTDKRAKTFRLSEMAWALLEALSTHHGVPMTAIMEMGIRRMARQDVPQAAERIEAEHPERDRRPRRGK
jgi:hypothetical protein